MNKQTPHIASMVGLIHFPPTTILFSQAIPGLTVISPSITMGDISHSHREARRSTAQVQFLETWSQCVDRRLVGHWLSNENRVLSRKIGPGPRVSVGPQCLCS